MHGVQCFHGVLGSTGWSPRGQPVARPTGPADARHRRWFESPRTRESQAPVRVVVADAGEAGERERTIEIRDAMMPDAAAAGGALGFEVMPTRLR
jgi:hypothetical protein